MAAFTKRASTKRHKSKRKARKLAKFKRGSPLPRYRPATRTQAPHDFQDVAAISEHSLKAIWDNPIDDKIWSNYSQTHQPQ